MIEREKTQRINCKKQQPKGKIVALSSVIKPSDIILNKIKLSFSNNPEAYPSNKLLFPVVTLPPASYPRNEFWIPDVRSSATLLPTPVLASPVQAPKASYPIAVTWLPVVRISSA